MFLKDLVQGHTLNLYFFLASILMRNYKSLKLGQFCLLNNIRRYVCFKTLGRIVGTFPRCSSLRNELASQKIMRLKLVLANPLSTALSPRLLSLKELSWFLNFTSDTLKLCHFPLMSCAASSFLRGSCNCLICTVT